MEIELRKLVGAPIKDLSDCIGFEESHQEMQIFIEKYDRQISSSSLYHEYEYLTITSEEDEAEMQRLATLGFQAVNRPVFKD
jgi:hypothetical protein